MADRFVMNYEKDAAMVLWSALWPHLTVPDELSPQYVRGMIMMAMAKILMDLSDDG